MNNIRVIEELERGLIKLKSNPQKYKKYNPSNGCGGYELLY